MTQLDFSYMNHPRRSLGDALMKGYQLREASQRLDYNERKMANEVSFRKLMASYLTQKDPQLKERDFSLMAQFNPSAAAEARGQELDYGTKRLAQQKTVLDVQEEQRARRVAKAQRELSLIGAYKSGKIDYDTLKGIAARDGLFDFEQAPLQQPGPIQQPASTVSETGATPAASLAPPPQEPIAPLPVQTPAQGPVPEPLPAQAAPGSPPPPPLPPAPPTPAQSMPQSVQAPKSPTTADIIAEQERRSLAEVRANRNRGETQSPLSQQITEAYGFEPDDPRHRAQMQKALEARGKRGQVNVYTGNNIPLNTTTASRVMTDATDDLMILGKIKNIQQLRFKPKEYLTYWAQGRDKVEEFLWKMGRRDKDADKRLAEMQDLESSIAPLFDGLRIEITGAGAGDKEIANLKESYLNKSMSGPKFEQALITLERGYKRAYRIRLSLIRDGLTPGTPEYQSQMGRAYDSGLQMNGDNEKAQRAMELNELYKNIESPKRKIIIKERLRNEGFEDR